MSQSGRLQSAPRFRLIRSWTLRQELRKYPVKALLGKAWMMGIFACSLCAEPRGVIICINNCSFVLYNIILCDFWMQVPLAFRIRWFVVHPLGGRLKTWGTRCGLNHLLFRGNLGVGDSLLIIWHCAKGEAYSISLSQTFIPISMCVLSHLPEV